MDARVYLAIVIVIALLGFSSIHKRKRRLLINEKMAQTKNIYRRESVFLCSFVEEIDDTLLQLYGESINSSLRPGMKI